MKKTIGSRILGETEVDEAQHITFNGTLFGFESYSDFYLLDFDDDGFFKLLQSEDDPNLCFVIISPDNVFPWYTLKVHDEDINTLHLESEEDLLVFAIVTIPEDMSQMTANLQGPVLINRQTKQGRQCIALNDDYTTRHKIVQDAGATV